MTGDYNICEVKFVFLFAPQFMLLLHHQGVRAEESWGFHHFASFYDTVLSFSNPLLVSGFW